MGRCTGGSSGPAGHQELSLQVPLSWSVCLWLVGDRRYTNYWHRMHLATDIFSKGSIDLAQVSKIVCVRECDVESHL